MAELAEDNVVVRAAGDDVVAPVRRRPGQVRIAMVVKLDDAPLDVARRRVGHVTAERPHVAAVVIDLALACRQRAEAWPHLIAGAQDGAVVAQDHVIAGAAVDEVAGIVAVHDVVAADEVVVAVAAVDRVAALAAHHDIVGAIGQHGGRIVGGPARTGVDQVITTQVHGLRVDGAVTEACVGDGDPGEINHPAQLAMIAEDEVGAVRLGREGGSCFALAVAVDHVAAGAAEDEVVAVTAINDVSATVDRISGSHEVQRRGIIAGG